MKQPLQAVVMFGGGVASFIAAKRAVARYGVENTALLFADTKEDSFEATDWGACGCFQVEEGRGAE